MKTSKVIFQSLITLIVTLLLLILPSCSGNVEIKNLEIKKNISIIVKMKDSDYWKTIKMGADAAAKEFNIDVRFSAPNEEVDIKGQVDMVEHAIKQKTDALILAASDYEALAKVTEKAYNAGIPVIAIDSELNSKKILSFIATDNRDAGRKAAAELVKVAGDNCRVAVMSSVKGTGNARQREEGIDEVLAKYPHVKIVAKEYCSSNVDIARELTNKILSGKVKADAFIALNDMSSIGVAEAVKQMALTSKVKVIAFDSTPEEIDYLEEDVIQTTIVQNPFNMGYLSVKYAVDAINGEIIPDRIDTGAKIINKGNLYLTENQKLLFPFVK